MQMEIVSGTLCRVCVVHRCRLDEAFTPFY